MGAQHSSLAIRNAAIPSVIRQQAVDHGTPMGGVTMFKCEIGSQSCFFETSLSGYFFLSQGTITGKGSVLMQREERNDDENGHSRNPRRRIQQMDGFENLSIELEYVVEHGVHEPISEKFE